MSVLAFKALSHGAEMIPDRFFEKIPGGFFTPAENKDIKKHRKERKDRHRSEERRRSHRDRSPPTDHSDNSGYDDTDHEREDRERQRQRRNRRTKSLGRSPSRDRSYGRSRHKERSRDVDGEYELDRAERGQDFPPPPAAEYRPYNPAEYAPSGGANPYYDQRAASARPDYGYAPQVNSPFRHRSVTVASVPPYKPANSCPPTMMARSSTNMSPFFLPPNSPTLGALSCASLPLQTAFSPSLEPPLATLLHRSRTNPPQPLGHRNSIAQARYTPDVGYTPSPAHASAPIPPPPGQGYAPYNPADYAPPRPATYAPNPSYGDLGNAYPSPPPFYRQQSRSQPSLEQYPDNTLPYEQPPSRYDSSASSRQSRHREGKRNRARSADNRGRSSSRVTDKFRGRFEDMSIKDRDLAASVGGALAGGLVGRQLGQGTLSTLAGAAIGAFGGRELEKKHDK
jgi:hypothetical protein